MCIESLTLSGTTGSWQPDYCVEAILHAVITNMINCESIFLTTKYGQGLTGPLRIDLHSKYARTLQEYSESEARAAFARQQQQHQEVGWGNGADVMAAAAAATASAAAAAPNGQAGNPGSSSMAGITGQGKGAAAKPTTGMSNGFYARGSNTLWGSAPVSSTSAAAAAVGNDAGLGSSQGGLGVHHTASATAKVGVGSSQGGLGPASSTRNSLRSLAAAATRNMVLYSSPADAKDAGGSGTGTGAGALLHSRTTAKAAKVTSSTPVDLTTPTPPKAITSAAANQVGQDVAGSNLLSSRIKLTPWTTAPADTTTANKRVGLNAAATQLLPGLPLKRRNASVLPGSTSVVGAAAGTSSQAAGMVKRLNMDLAPAKAGDGAQKHGKVAEVCDLTIDSDSDQEGQAAQLGKAARKRVRFDAAQHIISPALKAAAATAAGSGAVGAGQDAGTATANHTVAIASAGSDSQVAQLTAGDDPSQDGGVVISKRKRSNADVGQGSAARTMKVDQSNGGQPTAADKGKGPMLKTNSQQAVQVGPNDDLSTQVVKHKLVAQGYDASVIDELLATGYQVQVRCVRMQGLHLITPQQFRVGCCNMFSTPHCQLSVPCQAYSVTGCCCLHGMCGDSARKVLL